MRLEIRGFVDLTITQTLYLQIATISLVRKSPTNECVEHVESWGIEKA